jgi:hypothetical protein
MKKSILATLTSAALIFPSVATAQFDNGDRAPWADTAGFSTRGQCERFLHQFGNDLRKDPSRRDMENQGLSGGEWNRLYFSQWECTEDGGRWYITWQPE